MDNSNRFLIPLNQTNKIKLELSKISFLKRDYISKSDDEAVFVCVFTLPGMFRIVPVVYNR